MSSPEIVITSPSDKRLARLSWPDAGYEQSDPFETEPIYLVVPHTASDEALERLSKRFDVQLADLQAFCRRLGRRRSRIDPRNTEPAA